MEDKVKHIMPAHRLPDYIVQQNYVKYIRFCAWFGHDFESIVNTCTVAVFKIKPKDHVITN